MRVAVFSTKDYDREYLTQAAEKAGHELVYFEPRLTAEMAVLAAGFPAICSFVNDPLDAEILAKLAAGGTRFVALRCAGFNQVDLEAAGRLGIRVARVPAYSPHAVAEFAIGMILALNRKYHKAYHRVREGNFAIDGLLGFDLHGRVAGVVGTGQIGAIVARLLSAFGCRVLLYDPIENPACRQIGHYVPLDDLLAQSDILSLHCPLMPATKHLINERTIARLKRGVLLVNTSRGGLVDAQAVVAGLKSGQIGYLGLDVYEEEADLFFEDHSDDVIQDDVFMRLLTFPNVLITAHQAFFTENALTQIAAVTMENLSAFASGTSPASELRTAPKS
ncbi:MAG: 2-hydroxyacid dehydrogenase [Pirellulaceae bacterium]|nr:2-hydroxyacid dehydrogenase [Pirellulaceae bacterium]